MQVGLLLSISLLHRTCLILWYHGGSETRDYTNNHGFCVERDNYNIKHWMKWIKPAIFEIPIKDWYLSGGCSNIGMEPWLVRISQVVTRLRHRVWHSCKQQSLKIICYHPGSTGISFWLINLNFPILAFTLKRVFIVDCSWFLVWEPGQLGVCNRIWNWKQIKAPSIGTFFPFYVI